MAEKCHNCNQKFLSHSRNVSCLTCKRLFHLGCVPFSSISRSNHFHNSMCHLCLTENFPFHNIDDDDDFRLAISQLPKSQVFSPHNFENLIFNPIDFENTTEIQEQMAEYDPDQNFYNNYHCFQNVQNCSYYTDSSFNNKCYDKGLDNSNFSIIHFNIRSIPRNLSSADVYLSGLKVCFSVVAFTETWLNAFNCDCYCLPGYIAENKYRTNKIGGGVSIMIKQGINYRVREDLGTFTDLMESIFIEIPNKEINCGKNIIIGVIYRPPGNNIEDFNLHLTAVVDKLKKENKLIYLLGDFNVNIVNATSHPPTSDFLDIFYSASFFPLINRPTRITHQSATLIDNIFSNDIVNTGHFNGVLCCDISDHYPVFSCNLGTCLRTTPAFVKSRHFNNTSVGEFKERLGNTDWANVLDNNDAAEAFTQFYEVFTEIYDLSFPVTSRKVEYSNRKPWLSAGLKKSIKIKNQLYAIQRKYPTNNNIIRYKRYRGLVQKLLLKSQRDYYQNLIETNKGNVKKTWSVIKSIVNKNKGMQVTDTFNINNRQISDPFAIVESFNKFYVNVGLNLSKKYGVSEIHPTSYIKRHFPQSIFLSDVSNIEVAKAIMDLNNSSHGPDGISTNIFKQTFTLYLNPLVHLLNLSLRQGYFPRELKIARVIPIFKGGDPTEIKNYRPVSVLNVFSKVFEKLMYARIVDFFDKHKILYNAQFGFRKTYNTSNALIYLVDKIMSDIERGNFVVGTFIDLSKAFDCVNHSILLDKLYHYGIRGLAHKWFASYLQDRSQYVLYNDVESSKKNIICGVPQGSILGPILFLVYVNDLMNVSRKITPLMYADDTTLFISGTDISDLINDVNEELVEYMKWMKTNKLTVNADKSHFMIFRKNRSRFSGNIPHLCLNGESIPRVSTVRYLGVLLNETLSWLEHVNHIKGKIAKGIGIISKARKYVNAKTLLSLYYSFIYPYLIYCVEVWGCTCKTHLTPLIKLQKRAIRIVFSLSFEKNLKVVYKKFNILDLSQIYYFFTCLFVFKFRQGMLPDIFDSFFEYPFHQYRTRNHSRIMNIPPCKSSFSKMRMRYMGVKVHNAVFVNIQWNDSYESFKRNLKKYLVFHSLNF